jgi:phage portal protein BeeE
LPFTDFLPGLFRKADPELTTPAPVTLTDPFASVLFGAQPTYSNISVTPKTAMQVPAVALAVQTIANAVGGLPVKLYLRNGKGKEAAPAHPAFTLAHDEANPWTSAAELRAQLTRDALAVRRSLVLRERDSSAAPIRCFNSVGTFSRA